MKGDGKAGTCKQIFPLIARVIVGKYDVIYLNKSMFLVTYLLSFIWSFPHMLHWGLVKFIRAFLIMLINKKVYTKIGMLISTNLIY